MKKQLNLMEATLSHKNNLPDKELLKQASGGLALQGIYQTNHIKDLLEKREELLSLPEDISLLRPQQKERMETKEFLSSYGDSMFTESMEKLGFSLSFLAEGRYWEFSMDTNTNDTRSSESREVHVSCSKDNYSCTTKFFYIPQASCFFAQSQLRLSRPALQELKQLEDLLNRFNSAETLCILRDKGETFFKRFGSHVNQGPLHLGGVFWWKAVVKGFRSEELDDVKKQASETLDNFIQDSYSGFGGTALAGVKASNPQYHMIPCNQSSTNFKASVQLSVHQTGGPSEVDSLEKWKAGLMASNHSWCVIDRGDQLVPVWDIILSNHKQDFQNPLQLLHFLTDIYTDTTGTDIYTDLSGRCVKIQGGEDLQNIVKDARSFIEEVKSWEITEPQVKLRKLMNLKQMLSEKTRGHNTWINICLRDLAVQQFLVDTVSFCKNFPGHEAKFVKSQLHSLLYPHVYQVKDFPQRQAIMQWVLPSEDQQQQSHVTEFADFILLLEKAKKEIEISHNSESLGQMEEAQRKATYDISLSLNSLLKTLKMSKKSDTHLLMLSIAAGAGYKEETQTFHSLLGYEELNFLLHEMKEAHEKYQYLNKECVYRGQAFLLLIGLTVRVRPTVVSPEEKHQRLEHMQSKMENFWSKEVLQVLSKVRASHDWKTLEEDLNSLIRGEYEAIVNCAEMEEEKKVLKNVSLRKKKARNPEPRSNFLDLAKRLGLEHYYPRKMSRADFNLIHKLSVYDTEPDTEKQLPFYFLQKLLMLDYQLRYLVCKDDGDRMAGRKLTLTNSENDISDPYDDFCDDTDTPSHLLTTDQPHIHPMDIQMMIFHCADDFMRQYISNKLSICQFALPLLVPNPHTSEIEFPLWSFGQIKRSWCQVEKSEGEDKVININNQLISQAPIPIVSFIRVVKSTTSSKSQILNSLLSKHKHDVFFHRHCRGSSQSCFLMGGVVEISWFCPGERDDGRFDSCVAFTNLHGDAKDYEKQIRFLQEIASVTVVLVSASDQSEGTTSLVRELWKSPKPLVYLFDDKEKCGGNGSGLKVRIGIRNRNEAELMDELTSVINHLLKFSGPFLSLEDCADVARQYGFLVDVDRKECQEAKGKAQALIALMKETKLSEMKEQLLPLQGELWHQWCEKDKELYHLREKGNRSLEQHRSELEMEKQRIRLTQLKRAFPLNTLMRSVLEILQFHSERHKSTELYFLQWLNMFMDNLTRSHLEKLHKRLKQLSQFIAENQKGSKNDSKKKFQDELEDVSKEINDCSLGIEHFMREAGQIYEALEEYPSQRDDLFFSLPQIAADLMVSGYPFELMDGDASYVPLKWVAAVFDRLIQTIGDRKVFVLSVLGLQSTGKSTLLNAMFGLQFTVSAGRCTRGAYMQLLQVEETLQEELGFDFVLVVDTEGLRAIERKESQYWDNELATFVIGLGNLTLINIFGENPSEMQDILQIAVQAFLRMKQANISPSCLFVHQNVGEITAKDENMEGRRRLQQKLDEMTALAAGQEQCPHITCFNDVIRFNANTHVHYFAHLWEGDPPMAPPNPTYSYNVQALKKGILLAAKEECKGSILKMSQVKVRIQDLWKALVNENFIFSFKNTREIVAMSKLEAKYNIWTWQLRNHVLVLENQMNNQIQNGEIQDVRRSSIEDKVAEKYDRISEEFKKYFDEDQESAVLIQWKGSFEKQLYYLKKTLVSELTRKCKEILDSRNHQDNLYKKKSEYEKELLLKSREVALLLLGQELSEEELREKFNQLWTKWVAEVASSSPSLEEPKINVDLENVFLDFFKQEHNVASKLRDQNRRKEFLIDHEKHFIMKTKHIFKNFFTTLSINEEFVMKTTNEIISKVTETIESRLKMGRDYNISYFHEILQLIDKMADSASGEVKYTFTNEYKIDLSLYLCQRAVAKFECMHRAFKRANDPVVYLESKREDFFMSFKISCQGATSITVFAAFLWNKLTAALPIAIQKRITLDLAGEIRATCPAFNGNRANLEKHILISLAKEEKFEYYKQYIHNPEDFLKKYIEKEITLYCQSREDGHLKCFLRNCLEFFKIAILTAIRESSMVAKDQNNSVSVWLDTLCNHLGQYLTLPRGNLRSIEHQEIKDIDFLSEAMLEHLGTNISKVGETCEGTLIENVVPEIKVILSDQLGGCWIQCPFCKAICTNTIPNHDGDHSVPFHRPGAVSGTWWHNTDEFSLYFCTTAVASDDNFLLEDERRIPYKSYRQAGGEYATWSITPDLSAQPYWKWFVCYFRTELEDYYKLRFKGQGQIPDEWTRISKQDVLNDLNG